MKLLSRPVWQEGMHLAQHHFQTQSKYFEDSIAFAIDQLFFKAYGLAGCELDQEALQNGTVSLIHARGVMPDGLTFNIPEGDARPEPREIADLFSPTEKSHLVLLAIPEYRPGHKNCRLPEENGNEAMRYRSEPTAILDETTGADEKPVLLGIKNLRLRLDHELEDGQTYLPITRIKRHETGFVYDDSYIPPCLQIGASKRLMQMLARLIERLDAKSAQLVQQERPDAKSVARYAGSDVERYWQLHAIRSNVAPLRYHLSSLRTTPEALYLDMARLAGALSTFLVDATPESIPLYDHDHLEDCFDALVQSIEEFLRAGPGRRCISLPLRTPKDFPQIHGCSIKDDRCFTRKAEWYLAIRSPAPLAQVARTVSSSLKIASPRTLGDMVKRAGAGVSFEYVQQPPSVLSPRMGTAYFRLARTGKVWDAIADQKSVAIYVPKTLPQPQIEMLVALGE